MSAQRIGVLFVCYANICRSPLAEGTFRWLATRRGVVDRFEIDSAGVSAMDGAPPHPLSCEIAREQGFELEGQSRQLIRDDLSRFDQVVLMDRQNLEILRRLTGTSSGPIVARARVRLLREIASPHASGLDLDVPDPIGRGPEHYQRVFDMLEQGCNALLDELSA